MTLVSVEGRHDPRCMTKLQGRRLQDPSPQSVVSMTDRSCANKLDDKRGSWGSVRLAGARQI